MSVSTLAVYNFPCNVSYVGMKASLATCPERLLVSLPVFSTSTITYVQWDPSSEDLTPLQLHHESLAIPPPVKINRTLINDLDEKFQLYDNQLSAVRRKADSLIYQIEETFDSSYVEYVAFTPLGLSITNFIVFVFFVAVYSDIQFLGPTTALSSLLLSHYLNLSLQAVNIKPAIVVRSL